jgi:hypothetical protein
LGFDWRLAPNGMNDSVGKYWLFWWAIQLVPLRFLTPDQIKGYGRYGSI